MIKYSGKWEKIVLRWGLNNLKQKSGGESARTRTNSFKIIQQLAMTMIKGLLFEKMKGGNQSIGL